MNKWETLQDFWGGFGIPAYDENSVPHGAQMPYITYEARVGGFENLQPITASIWYRSASWAEASQKADAIERRVASLRGSAIPVDGGRLRLWQGDTPFAQRMRDEADDMVKRIVINLVAEFMTLT